ncbi:MAG TPA: cytochrome c3 family protein [Anaeromyxobacter sp.]|nr:cytochrome c3 family protein [Anaeromyxobacter sp.]
MNRIPAILLALAFATIAAAANPPDEVKIPNKNGEITFHHAKHKEVKCETCHGTANGGKIKLDKDSGHKLCQDCHKANKDKGASIVCKTCHSGAKS